LKKEVDYATCKFIFTILNAIARDKAKTQRIAEAERKRAERASAATAKEAKVKYLESRVAEVEDLNAQLKDCISELS
jgi:hypothetical protein